MRGLGIFVLMALALSAQEVPLQRPEERLATRQQAQALFDSVGPLVRPASKSTVWVYSNGKHVAMGTVVGDGNQVLTKWSEIAFARDQVQVTGGDGREATATVQGIYQDDDLALLQIDGESFKAVTLSDEPAPGVGRFLVAAGPDATALSLGVVAVAERTLRESDQAFIGITLDAEFEGTGVRVREVVESGGADEAGVKVGDVIRSIEGESVASAFELRNVLLEYSPGEIIEVQLDRKDGSVKLEVTLAGRPEFPGIPEDRLRKMRRMGGPVSLVNSKFPMVIQTDMQLKPNQCGGPILDLNGEVVGVTISRTDRTRSFIIPASRIRELLDSKPMDPALVAVPRIVNPQRRVARPRSEAPKAAPMKPGTADRLRRHLEEMAELLERMDREMQEVDE